MLKFYGYDKCDTCRKARRWLDGRGVKYAFIDITTTPPDKATLKAILASGTYELKQLFNRSGDLYREMNLKDKLPTLSETQAIDLLAKHGRLCKRPLVTDGQRHSVGFDPTGFESLWK